MTDKPEKIIVDEDWKAKVEAEKTAVNQPQQPEPAPEGPEPPPPPADLMFLAGSLYVQAMVGMGLIANPISREAKRQLPQARHAIDLLQVLFDKTQGNRTPQESDGLESMLHELRMTFISVSSGDAEKK